MLPDYEPTKPYFLKLLSNDDIDTRISVAHLATLKLWNNPNASPAEFKAWLGVLEYAFLKDKSHRFEAMTSIQYDLNSLKIKFANNSDFVKMIEKARRSLRGKHGLLLVSSVPYPRHDRMLWEREVFGSFHCISKELENLDDLKALIASDEELLALLNPDQNHDPLESLKKITRTFGTWNSYKRVITLAVCSHAFSGIKNPLRGNLLIHLQSEVTFLPNEAALLISIANKHGYVDFPPPKIYEGGFFQDEKSDIYR